MQSWKLSKLWGSMRDGPYSRIRDEERECLEMQESCKKPQKR